MSFQTWEGSGVYFVNAKTDIIIPFRVRGVVDELRLVLEIFHVHNKEGPPRIMKGTFGTGVEWEVNPMSELSDDGTDDWKLKYSLKTGSIFNGELWDDEGKKFWEFSMKLQTPVIVVSE